MLQGDREERIVYGEEHHLQSKKHAIGVPGMKLRPVVVAMWTIATLLSLSGCSKVGETSGALKSASTLPDISGLAWISGDQFLAVHDAKASEDRARVSLVELPASSTGPTRQTLEVSWPGSHGFSNDLESAARIPSTSLFLLLESGSGRQIGPRSRRIFLAELEGPRLEILDVANWPVLVKNVEGAAVARVGEQLIFLFAERAEGQPSTLLRWASLMVQPLAFGSFQEVTFTSPDPTGPHARPVSAIEIDETGRIYVASAVDPGNNNGPFRSVIWRIGRMDADGSGKPRAILDERPQRLASLDGVKVEGLTVRENNGGNPDIFFGTDDENYGGILRLVPGEGDR
jgi:hypothetical protein